MTLAFSPKDFGSPFDVVDSFPTSGEVGASAKSP